MLFIVLGYFSRNFFEKTDIPRKPATQTVVIIIP